MAFSMYIVVTNYNFSNAFKLIFFLEILLQKLVLRQKTRKASAYQLIVKLFRYEERINENPLEPYQVFLSFVNASWLKHTCSRANAA